jgi:hypothetical protein
MRRFIAWAAIAAALLAIGMAGHATAEPNTYMGTIAYQRSLSEPWHGGYYHTDFGMPVALVVPPTAEVQTHWGWGVGNFRISTIQHQYNRNWPGAGYYHPAQLRPTPYWPSHTDQFGVYYVRGPW